MTYYSEDNDNDNDKGDDYDDASKRLVVVMVWRRPGLRIHSVLFEGPPQLLLCHQVRVAST